MRTARRITGWGAAALAAVLIATASPAAALPDESEAGDVSEVTLVESSTASLQVAYFADVVLDGVYDPSIVFEDRHDELVTSDPVFLRDAAGQWWQTTAGDDKYYRFPGVAAGPATLYVGTPEEHLPVQDLPTPPMAMWDATEIGSSATSKPRDSRPSRSRTAWRSTRRRGRPLRSRSRTGSSVCSPWSWSKAGRNGRSEHP